MWIHSVTFTIHTTITNAPHLSLLCVRLRWTITSWLCDEHSVFCTCCNIIDYQIIIDKCFDLHKLDLRYCVALLWYSLSVTLDWYAKLTSLVVTHNSQFTTCEQHHSVSLTHSQSLDNSRSRPELLRYLHSHEKLADWSKSNKPSINYEILFNLSLLSHVV